MGPLYLKEDFPEDNVVLVLEDGGEDDRHSVGLGLDVHRLVVAVVDDGRFLALFFGLLRK
jgi:hypothetical protein